MSCAYAITLGFLKHDTYHMQFSVSLVGLLFSKFRFGWKMNLHVVPSKPSNKPTFRTFMVIAEKDKSADSYQIKSSVEQASLDCDKNQVCCMIFML